MRCLFQLTLTLTLTVASSLASAHDYELGDIHIEHPWTRATPPRAEVAGAYMTFENAGAADSLIGGSTPVAAHVEIHTMAVENGVMTMRQLPDGLELPAGQDVALAPGGFHVMLIGLAKPLREGERVPLTLTFAKAGKVDVQLAVEAMGATGMDHDAHSSIEADQAEVKP